MNPTEPTGPSTLPGSNLLDLKAQLQAEITANSVNGSQLYAANALAGRVDAWRVVTRGDGADKAAQNWGPPIWDESPTGQDGTTNLQWLTRWMSGHPDVNSGWPANYPQNGMAEVQIKYQGIWYSAASILNHHPMVAVEKGSELYVAPSAPPAFTPMVQISSTPIADPITGTDVVGAQFAMTAWHISAYGAMMLAQVPNPSGLPIQAPGPYTQAVSPTGKLVFHANPFAAGNGYWFAE